MTIKEAEYACCIFCFFFAFFALFFQFIEIMERFCYDKFTKIYPIRIGRQENEKVKKKK